MPNELWFSIVPSITAIILATWTKQVIPSFLIGLWLGSLSDCCINSQPAWPKPIT
jgi:Na+/H+ antiporter NhaC